MTGIGRGHNSEERPNYCSSSHSWNSIRQRDESNKEGSSWDTDVKQLRGFSSHRGQKSLASLVPRTSGTMSKEGSVWGAQGKVRMEESRACLSASSAYEWSAKILIHRR